MIEILVVVAIMGIMTAGVLVSLASGRAAAHVREAGRGVAQLTHYAASLALVRQRRAVVEYAGGRITVKLSGKALDTSDVGKPARAIYDEVDGQEVPDPVPDEPADADAGTEASAADKDEAGYLYTRRVLDEEELLQTGKTLEFKDIVFSLELLDDAEQPLDEEEALRVRNTAQTVANTCVSSVKAWSSEHGELSAGGADKSAADDERAKPQAVVFETNGNCVPHRVTIRETRADDFAADEGDALMTVTVLRSGRVRISKDEDDAPARTRSRRGTGRSRR